MVKCPTLPTLKFWILIKMSALVLLPTRNCKIFVRVIDGEYIREVILRGDIKEEDSPYLKFGSFLSIKS